MIVVTGATGHLGNVLVRKLLENGEDVTVIARSSADLKPLEGLNVESYLRMGGVSQEDLAAVRKRLLG